MWQNLWRGDVWEVCSRYCLEMRVLSLNLVFFPQKKRLAKKNNECKLIEKLLLHGAVVWLQCQGTQVRFPYQPIHQAYSCKIILTCTFAMPVWYKLFINLFTTHYKFHEHILIYLLKQSMNMYKMITNVFKEKMISIINRALTDNFSWIGCCKSADK